MLVKEMHIQFSLGLQKLGANSRRKFYEQEIDAILNEMQDRFILDQVKISPEDRIFQSTQIDVDKIRPLVRRVEITAGKTLVLGRDCYEVALPCDYAHLINNSWHSAKDCTSIITSTEPEYITLMRFGKTTKASAPFYGTIKITFNGNEILNVAGSTQMYGANNLYTGYPSVEDRFSAIKLTQDLFNEKLRNGVIDSNVKGLYWEYYRNKYYPGHFILVAKTNSAASLEIDGSTFGAGPEDWSFTKQTPLVSTVVSGRQVKASYIDQVLDTPFYGPTQKSPISVLSGTTLTVYPHKSYIVNKASLSYVRRASRIDLSLQRNCELAPEFHQTIVDMAVEYAAGRLEQQMLYQVQNTENTKNK